MQVCTSLQTDNHASTSPLSFFTGRMPFLPPNQQRQSTEGKSVLDKHTIQYNIQKTYKQKKQQAKSAKRKRKWRTAAMRDSRNNINDTDNTGNLSCVN